MSDTQGTDPIDADAETLIQELLDAGFAYESNGRLAGLAEPEVPDEGDTESGSGDGSEDADGGGALEPGPGADDGDVDGGADGDTGGDVAGEPARGAHSGRLELKGTPLTELEAENLLRIRQVLIDHPEMVEEMEARLSGRVSVPPQQPAAETPPEPPRLPEFIDPDDEASVRMWGEVQRVANRQEQVDSAVSGALEEASAAKVQADIGAAVDRFKVDHPDLSDEDIANIRNYTSANVNIPGVMANYPLDPVTGLVKSLEIGSMSDPSVRDKVLQIQRDDSGAKDRARQKDLDKLSGSSGSARRGPPKPKKAENYQQAAQMLAQELEALNGTTP